MTILEVQVTSPVREVLGHVETVFVEVVVTVREIVLVIVLKSTLVTVLETVAVVALTTVVGETTVVG